MKLRSRRRRAAFRYLAEHTRSERSEASDRLVRALRELGVPVAYGRDPHRRDRAPRRSPTLAALDLAPLSEARARVPKGVLVAQWPLASDTIVSNAVALLDRCDRVVVPTNEDRDLLLDAGVGAPVAVVPHIAADPIVGDGGVPLGLPRDVVCFYTQTGIDGRDVTPAVRAYLDAFTADDPVVLIVRTEEASGLGALLDGRTRPALVRVERGVWTTSRTAGLHVRGDAYLSPAAVPGRDLGALDAQAYGNPVVSVTGGDDREAAVEALRRIAADPAEARRQVAPASERLLRERSPRRVAAALLEAAPELTDHSARPLRPAPIRDDLLLVGIAVGPWRPAFDNWVEMAERHGFTYELVGREVVEPYLAHATTCRLMLDLVADQPRRRPVLFVDTTDGFVCDGPTATLERFRSYGAPVVLGSGACIGEAGVLANALREGFERQEWYAVEHFRLEDALLARFGQDAHAGELARDEHGSIARLIGAQDDPSLPVSASAVHFGVDRGDAYNAHTARLALAPVPLSDDGRIATPGEIPPRPEPPQLPPDEPERIPRIAHYVFGLGREPEPFHLIHYLALRSCIEMARPDEVRLHCAHVPHGEHWDRVASHVCIERIDAPARPELLALDVLLEHGGLYADLDTLFLTRLPGRLWRAPCVVSRDSVRPGPVLMAKPRARFLAAWRKSVNGRCADIVAGFVEQPPNDVWIEPRRTFQAFEPSREGLALLLDHSVRDLDGVVALHLMTDHWAPQDRHPQSIDESWIRGSDSTYARAARRFLDSP